MNKLVSLLNALIRRVHYGDRIQPTRDWFVLVAAALVFLLASFVSNLVLFARVTGGELVGEPAGTPALDATSIDQVQALFQKRTAEENRYRSEYRFVDPSL